MMQHVARGLLLGSIVASSATAWERAKDVTIRDVARLDRPHIRVVAEKEGFAIGEPMALRFQVENATSGPITTVMEIALDPLSTGVIEVQLSGPGTARLAYEVHECGTKVIGVLSPGEVVSRDYALGYLVETPGCYTATAYYLWRGGLTWDEDPAHRLTASEGVDIVVRQPAGVDGDVFAFVGFDVLALLALQDPALDFMLPKGTDTDALRREVMSRFPSSSYCRQVRLALARRLIFAGHYDEAKVELEKYIKDYPKSWFADEARYDLAKVELKLGHPAAAHEAASLVVQATDSDEEVRRGAIRLLAGGANPLGPPEPRDSSGVVSSSSH